MAKRIIGSTPKADGYRMPAEFEPQDGVWMLWPERNDNWRSGAKPAQETFCQVARAIARFEKVTMCVSAGQYQNARARLPEEIRVVEVSSNDAWVRDCGPTFLVNGQGGLRAVDWTFNAWGGLYDGLYFPWDKDDQVAQKICEMVDVDSYRTEGFVLEGGSIHVDGEGTVLTTEMCLLSEGRNPDMDRGAIERMLCDYLAARRCSGCATHRSRGDQRPHRRRGVLHPPGRGRLHLDGRPAKPVLSAGARRLRHALAGDGRQRAAN